MRSRAYSFIALLLFSSLFTPTQKTHPINIISPITAAFNYTWNTVQEHPYITATICAAIPSSTYAVLQTAQRYYYKNLRWDWNALNINKLTFPKGFLFGAGTAAHQVEGGCDNNTWSPNSPYAKQLQETKQKELGALWESQKDEWAAVFKQKQGRMPTEDELTTYKENYFTFCFAGDACNSWNNYEDDVACLKELGCTAYRFSVEWSKVMPTKNSFDEDALQHYCDVCDALMEQDIKPVITLYHYTEPLWFAQKGGFEKDKNIKYYVKFCSKLFEKLGDRVHLYFTFNSPIGGIALNSYYKPSRPPFKKDLKLTFTVMQNLLDAHVAVYKAKQEINPALQIGILKNIHQLDPWRIWHPLDRLVCSIGNKLMDDPFYQFFTTGKIRMEFPFGLLKHIPKVKNKHILFEHENKDAPICLDFIGLNYYGHRYMKGTQLHFDPQEERCGTPGNKHPAYTMYAEGIYRALHELNDKLVKPIAKTTGKRLKIYVTENGIGTEDDNQRTEFMRRYLYAISRANQDGCDIGGYFCWSLMDNYEWGTYSKRYGLFHVDLETQERTLKKGSKYYQEVIATYKRTADAQVIEEKECDYSPSNYSLTK